MDNFRKKLEAVIDYEFLLEQIGGDEEFAIEFLQSFLDSYDESLQQIRDAVHARDADQLESSAHGFKGMLLTIYARHAFDSVRELEEMGINKDMAAADIQFSILQESVHTTASAIREAMMVLD